MKKFLRCFVFYFSLFFILEYVYKISVFNIWIDVGLIYTALFTTIYALFFTILTIFLPSKMSFPINLILFIIVTVIFIGEAMFTHFYDSTFSIYSINLASQVYDFRRILYDSLLDKWFMIFMFIIPLILFILFYKKVFYHIQLKKISKYIFLYFGVHIVILMLLNFDKNTSYSAHNLYYNNHAPTLTAKKFGILTEFKLDIKRYLFGFTPKINLDHNDIENILTESNNLEYNKLELDFNENTDENITKLNNYFSKQSATNKNEYTGIFKDKNIIYILAEGFNSIAVDKEVTPTLYKLVNSSFVFENYYSPMFMSTTGGEFQFSTSLIPTQQSLNTWKEGNANFPYAIGNVFNDMGYEVMAFHNYKYNYYKRQITMPTLGFDTYTACGNGLETKMNCKKWPPSDIEMIEATVDKFINKDKFAIHYITVSGHAEYNFFGNNMAMKNQKLVKDLKFSTAIKAYLATQIELDKALEILLKRLENTQKLDNTVIVLSGDHYPYNLSIDEINEISTYERDETFEVHKSNLIIYNPKLETTIIDKLASSVDVLPTILNMFNYNYDSRLLMGKDIMSNHESLVIFTDHSWITEKGRYNIASNIFIPNDGIEVAENYVSNINNEVQNRVNVSTQVVESDYYTKILSSQSTK